MHAVVVIAIKHKLLDPQINYLGLKSRKINKVLAEVKRCESMPSRHGPVTVLMVLHMRAKCAHLHPDCLDSALHNWNALGLHYGCCLSEWVQNNADKIMLTYIDGLPTVFVCKDMIFFGANNRKLPQSWSYELDASKIAFV